MVTVDARNLRSGIKDPFQFPTSAVFQTPGVRFKECRQRKRGPQKPNHCLLTVHKSQPPFQNTPSFSTSRYLIATLLSADREDGFHFSPPTQPLNSTLTHSPPHTRASFPSNSYTIIGQYWFVCCTTQNPHHWNIY